MPTSRRDAPSSCWRATTRTPKKPFGDNAEASRFTVHACYTTTLFSVNSLVLFLYQEAICGKYSFRMFCNEALWVRVKTPQIPHIPDSLCHILFQVTFTSAVGYLSSANDGLCAGDCPWTNKEEVLPCLKATSGDVDSHVCTTFLAIWGGILAQGEALCHPVCCGRVVLGFLCIDTYFLLS